MAARGPPSKALGLCSPADVLSVARQNDAQSVASYARSGFENGNKEAVMHSRFFSGSLVALIGSAVLAQGALAGGEPKNEWPFTRIVGVRTVQSATHSTISSGRAAA